MTCEKVRVPLENRAYDILIAPGLFSDPALQAAEALRKFTEGRAVLTVADSHTAPLFADRVCGRIRESGAASSSLYSFEAGEPFKNLATVEAICRAAFQAGLDRSSLIVALGGGVTGDLAGFAAAIYMRGIDCIQIPTSLLAMIDSSVGGKTGADLQPEGKNLIGAFHQPKTVLMDPDFLNSLPPVQLRSGFAELLKHAILFDPELVHTLSASAAGLLALDDLPLLSRLIARSCALKASVVAGDEREKSTRALLNLGHSFGHALEKLQNFNGFSHGEAVAFGIAAASALSNRLGKLKNAELHTVRDLLSAYGLPVSVSGFTPEAILSAMRGDKKNIGGVRRLVLPLRIGQSDIFSDVPDEPILSALGDCCD